MVTPQEDLQAALTMLCAASQAKKKKKLSQAKKKFSSIATIFQEQTQPWAMNIIQERICRIATH